MTHSNCRKAKSRYARCLKITDALASRRAVLRIAWIRFLEDLGDQSLHSHKFSLNDSGFGAINVAIIPATDAIVGPVIV